MKEFKIYIIAILILLICITYQVLGFAVFPPIHRASGNGDLSALHRLLNKKVDPNKKSGYFYTPLYVAIKNNQSAAVELLLTYGANPNAMCPMESLLNQAIKMGNLKVVDLLINHGANIDMKDKYNGVPLSYAITLDRMDIVDILLKNHANIMIELDENGVLEDVTKKNPRVKAIYDRYKNDVIKCRAI